jgi:hypothetical protein
MGTELSGTSRRSWARLLILAMAMLPAYPAASQPLGEKLALDPPIWDVSGVEIQAGGAAQGALFGQSQGGQKAASGLLNGNLRLRRIFDNGMILGGRGDFLLYRDALSSDNYGGDTVQKLYLFLQMGFGRLDIGQQDGAAAALSLRGPVVDSKLNLADRGITLFRDPQSGASLAGVFAPMIAVAATSNYAKFNYTTPRLFGVQAGLSFTPQAVRVLSGWNVGGLYAWGAEKRNSGLFGFVRVAGGGAACPDAFGSEIVRGRRLPADQRLSAQYRSGFSGKRNGDRSSCGIRRVG